MNPRASYRWFSRLVMLWALACAGCSNERFFFSPLWGNGQGYGVASHLACRAEKLQVRIDSDEGLATGIAQVTSLASPIASPADMIATTPLVRSFAVKHTSAASVRTYASTDGAFVATMPYTGIRPSAGQYRVAIRTVLGAMAYDVKATCDFTVETAEPPKPVVDGTRWILASSPTSDGGHMVYGQATGWLGGAYYGGFSQRSVFVARRDASGNERWVVQLGNEFGDSSLENYGFRLRPDGSFFIAGTMRGPYVDRPQVVVQPMVGLFGADGVPRWLSSGVPIRGIPATYGLVIDQSVLSASGELYLAGRHFDTATAVPADAIVLRYGTSGASGHLTLPTGGGPTNSAVVANLMKFGPTGRLHLAGNTLNATIGTPHGVPGITDAFIASVEADLTGLVFDRFGAGVSSTSLPMGLLVDANDEAYLYGSTTGGTGMGGIVYGTATLRRGFVIRSGALPARLLVVEFAAPGGPMAVFHSGGLDVDASGDIVFCGSVQGALAPTQWGTPGTRDLFVARLNPLGAIRFSGQFNVGATANADAMACRLRPDGSIALAGASGMYLANGAEFHALLLSIGPTGALEWENRISLGTWPLAQFQPSRDGGWLISGNTMENYGGNFYGPAGYSGFVMKTNALGVRQWVTQASYEGQNASLTASELTDGTVLFDGTITAGADAPKKEILLRLNAADGKKL